MNTASIAATAIPASLVLISGSGLLAMKSAVRKGCTVTLGVTFKLAPAPAKPDTFQADASRFQTALDEALDTAAVEAAASARAAAEAAHAVPESPPASVLPPVREVA